MMRDSSLLERLENFGDTLLNIYQQIILTKMEVVMAQRKLLKAQVKQNNVDHNIPRSFRHPINRSNRAFAEEKRCNEIMHKNKMLIKRMEEIVNR